ncbi:UDP-N-acetylmuramoyl-L-alanyl-D-glutamate--2,6-diaminopimelate ligase [Helicobacter cappadocius]|uniref:UDP-N-acetylmuramoyl-L-alanyl-D-glutamate--2,6-diaminopimelate ligase n=1 Tax=Helicobacter cappadocius TaxID=3063998 RepID=A0AA90TFI5_9HELI|nr:MULTISPECIES: UDP-N-acetylmuramoyl-L-alanyl-D-glutamate--2,6-diaminopimelate ligase [unclassified Helicobacter]MDO7253747.1 UDP-N-acetylmuramoyl-L-alanyl-D-glutamate--2,6-diaminopimelate ligase [Helicobacter sp. faydin-H75]MDP2539675.1 UDP-N-acetylmuramoyl-L-alanyl-D-glutamate--2,6-diaminopimelate ligase [Helicobacter sp. faydin-H76]
MKIQKRIEYNGKIYNFLSDDSRDVINNSDSLFVHTKQNSSFVNEVKKHKLDILQARDLKKYFKMTPKIIGITGTNGKTTTAAIIYSILLDMGYLVALLGTRGFFINDKEIKPKGLTTPSILELYEDIEHAAQLECEYFVMEVSSHAIEQERIEGLDFLAKILTNITSDHLDYHKTLEEYIRIKNSFFADEGIKIINRDENKALYNPINSYSYAINSKANLCVSAYSPKKGIHAHIIWRESLRENHFEETFVDSSLYGVHNLYNILGAITCVKIITQRPLEEIATKLENFAGVSGRMEVVSQSPLIIVDFAHTHDGMKQIFESFKSKNISVVFGAGGDRDKSKRSKMGECASSYAQKIYITSDNPRSEDPQSIIEDILKGIPENLAHPIITTIDRKKAIQKAIDDLEDNDVLLVLGKGDETYQIIGNQKIHFDDREIIREYLNPRKGIK